MIQNRRAARSPLSWGGAVIAAVFLCGPLPCPADAAPPSARRTFVVTDFDTVRLEAPIDATIVTGKGASAIGTGDRDTLDALELTVNGNALTIRMRKVASLGGSGGKARLPTRIAITTGELRRATVSGAGNLTADRLKGQRTEATLRGAGAINVGRVATDRLDVGLLGAGSMTLGGTALQMTATISGSGRLDAVALDARRIKIDTEGAVDAQVSAREEAIVGANGDGRLVVGGNAKCTVRKMGNASVTCGGEVY